MKTTKIIMTADICRQSGYPIQVKLSNSGWPILAENAIHPVFIGSQEKQFEPELGFEPPKAQIMSLFSINNLIWISSLYQLGKLYMAKFLKMHVLKRIPLSYYKHKPETVPKSKYFLQCFRKVAINKTVDCNSSCW